MTDVDEQILTALDSIVGAAPPPVSVDSIRSAGSQPLPPDRGRRRQLLATAVIVIAVAAVGGGVGWFQSGEQQVPTPVEAGDDTDDSRAPTTPQERSEPREMIVTVPDGAWLTEIVPQVAGQLPQIDQEELWLALETVQPGHPFGTEPEAAARAAGVQGLTADRLRWEGLLFASEVTVADDADGTEVIRAMHDEFLRVTLDLEYDRAPDLVGFSAYEVVIIASLVEAEARSDADRSKIARVIHNRLAEDIPLAIDAPYVYREQDRDVAITRSLLETPGPYGTRTGTGLPPTPISTPGRSSLLAAIEPQDGPWLFYTVADEQGNMAFATTLDEHNANVAMARELGLFD